MVEALKQVKDESGKSLDELNLIHSFGVDRASGTVSVKLKLTKDYRKAKSLVTKRLEAIDWVQNVKVNMAPKD